MSAPCRRAVCLALCLVAGCARYTPEPLATVAPLAASLISLDLHGVDATRPLQVQDVALLAVANSPDLAATRGQRGVSQAQILQSSLLANPALTGAILPLLAGLPPGTGTIGYNAALSYDVRSLLTRRTRRQEAAATGHSLDATLLWQEWQTIAQARLLCVDIVMGDRALDILRQSQDIVRGRATASRAALDRGDVTLATAAPDESALQAARNAAYEQERVQLGRRHQLAALLGLSPDAALTLAPEPAIPAIDQAAVRHALPHLADQRPDLAALRFGYQAEDGRLRTAILSQFPNLSIGVTGGSDNSNVRSIGPQITLDLPVFDHAQGLIAVERATREQMHAEYSARLANATGQVLAMLGEMDLLGRQLADLRRDQPGVLRAARAAEAARRSGDLDERSALDLILARSAKAQEITLLEQALLEQQVAIATLIGAGLPPLTMHGDHP